MNISAVRSDLIYKKIMIAPLEKRNDIYRYELMKPFEKKWDCYNIPIKASKDGGYDVVMASSMLGFLPPNEIDDTQQENIMKLSSDDFWDSCQKSLEKSAHYFSNAGIDVPVKEYLYTILLANPESPYTKLNDGYCGDGGIPGFIFGSLVPNEDTIKRLPVALAHEFNHNVRFQFEKWKNDISLGEMMISEGLAENFAATLYGEHMVGPWVSKTDIETLNEYIKPLIKEALDVTGFENITAYLYGDEMAKLQNYFPVGMPYCAGYACGYHMVKYYLENTNSTIVEATLAPSNEILNAIEGFWN